MEQKPKKSKPTPFTLLFPATMELFFMQLSPIIFEQVVKRVSSFVFGSWDSNIIKEMGNICGSAAYAQPAVVLKIFIPQFHKAIVGVDGKALEKKSEEELNRLLRTLAFIVRNAGNALLSHRVQLEEIITATVDSTHTEVYKASNKLLHSLTQYYPLEYRSVNPDVWNSPDFANTHFQNWGSTCDNRMVSWHEPSTEEYQLGRHIVELYLLPSFDVLSALTKVVDGTSFKKDQALRHLSRVRSFLIGGSAFFIPLDGSRNIESHRLLDGDMDERGWYALKSPPSVINAHSNRPQLMSDIREKVGQLVDQWINFLIHKRQDEVTCIEMICKISYHLLSNYGADTLQKRNRITLEVLKNKWRASHDRRMKTRNFVVMKALAEASFHIPFEPWVQSVHQGLLSLSFSPYTEIRKKSQGVLRHVIKRHPKRIKKLVHDLISRLNNHSASKDELAGVLHLLLSNAFLTRIISDWALRKDFTKAISACSSNPQWPHTIQSYFMRLLATFCAKFKYVSLHMPHPSGGRLVQNPNILKNLEERNIAAENDFVQVVESLSSMLEAKTTNNWKLQMMVATLLSWYTQNLTEGKLVIPAERPLVGSVRWTIRTLTSETPPLRAITVRFVSSLLRSVKGTNTNTRFKVKNYYGWNSHVLPTPMEMVPTSSTTKFTLGSLLLPLLANSDIELRQPAFVGLFIQYLADDRPIKSGSDEGGEDPMISALKKRFHFLGRFTDVASVLGQFVGAMSPDQQQEATGNMLAELLKTDRHWPHTRSPLQASDGFNTTNARLFKGLFKVFGTSYIDLVSESLIKLLSKTERTCQCTAAEILAGALRADAISTTFGDSRSELIRKYFIQGLTGAPPDCIVDWMTSIRFAFYNRAPDAAVWLTDHLIQQHTSLQASSLTNSTASAQAKPLYFLKAAIAEFTWRTHSLHRTLITHLCTLLAHPYKQLRQEIAEILAMIIGFSWLPHKDIISNRSMLCDALTINEYSSSFLTEVLNVLNEQENFSSQTPSIANEQLFLHTRTCTRATILHLVLHAFTQGNATSLKRFLPDVVPHLFNMQVDSDQEVAHVAKQTSALLAQAQLSPKILNSLSKAVSSTVVSSQSWKVRAALLPFIQILAYNHIFLVKEQDVSTSIYQIVLTMLGDPQIEVRELGRVALSSLLKCLCTLSTPDGLSLDILIDRFTKLVDVKLARRAVDPVALLSCHQGVLGLAGIVGAHPYDMPLWLPNVLVSLAAHVADPMPIAETVRKTFMEFWRTHQDTWQEEQLLFSERQLSTLKELLVSPSYYA